MKDLNRVCVAGRLTRDAELKNTNGGTAVLRFSIANNDRKKKGDKWEDVASYFDCVIWGKPAETLAPYLKKGSAVEVDGHLTQSRWEQNGENRSKVEITAEFCRLTDGNSKKTTEQAEQSFADADIPF